MSNRLPAGIKKIELKSRKDGRPSVRYDVLVDTGIVNGRRTHVRKRCKTEADAREFQAETIAKVKKGVYVHKTKLTVEQACSEWLASKHGIKQSTMRGYEIELAPVREALGNVELQKLSKGDLDKLVQRLKSGDDPKRGKWAPRSINGLLGRLSAVLEDKLKQGEIVRNVAKLVDRIPAEQAEMKTLSEEDMYRVLDFPDRDRHLWALALCMGLRRGEIAGLRWKYVDFEARTIEIAETRVCVGSKILTETPKSQRSKRVLPMPDEVFDIMKEAHDRIESVYVACGRDGVEYHPNYVTERWEQMLRAAKIDYVRLHDARHTCASYMHFKGVPIATISKWMGHSTAAFTMSVYVHNQDKEFKQASAVFRRNDG